MSRREFIAYLGLMLVCTALLLYIAWSLGRG